MTDPLIDLQRQLGARLRAVQAPGAVLAVVEAGTPLLRLAVGQRDLWGLLPLGVDAVMPIYSVTKVALAQAALRLVAEGVLTLEDRHGLPGGGEATLRQLLTHTSGLADYGADPAYLAALQAAPRQPWSFEEHLQRAALRGRSEAPWAYSNVGYMLVRAALERATGLGLGPALASLVLRPLGLSATRLVEGPEDALGHEPGHSTLFSSGNEVTELGRQYHPGWVGHGLLASTATEAAVLIEAVARGALLPPALAAEVLQPVTALGPHPRLGPAGQGLGVVVVDGPTGRAVGHTGEGPGYSAAAWAFERPGGGWVGVAALANRDVPDLGLELVLDAARVLLSRQG